MHFTHKCHVSDLIHKWKSIKLKSVHTWQICTEVPHKGTECAE